MKAEPKVGQVWKLKDRDCHYKILSIYHNWVWMAIEGCAPVSFHTSALTTMILDEHGNKPTEDNDDVVFYDVVEDGDGPYGVKDKRVGGLVFTTDGVIPLADLLGCKDEDGRTCVGFLYERSDHVGYYLSITPISFDGISSPIQGPIWKAVAESTTHIPVKAVFKRLEARS